MQRVLAARGAVGRDGWRWALGRWPWCSARRSRHALVRGAPRPGSRACSRASTAAGQLIFLPFQATVIELAGWRDRDRHRRRRGRPGRRAGVCCSCATSRGRSDCVPYGADPRGADRSTSQHRGPATNPFRLTIDTLGRGCAAARLLVLLSWQLRRVRRHDRRPDQRAPDPGVGRARHPRGDRGRHARGCGLFDLVGTTFSGWLTDRIDARKLLV